MTGNRSMHVEGIVALERCYEQRLRELSERDRAGLLAAACRMAATVEASRRKMGLPPVVPAPWPDSTWKFLAESARRVRER